MPTFAFATLPPPVHGLSFATKRFLETTQDSVDWEIWSLGNHGSRRWLGQLGRLGRNLRALAHLAFASRQTMTSVYMPVSAGATMVYNVTAATLCRLRGIPLVLHHHSYAYLDRDSLLFRALNRQLGPKDAQICLSEQMSESLFKRYAVRSQTIVLPNSFVLEEADDTEEPEVDASRGIRIGFLCNMTFAKGLRIVVETFEELVRQLPEATLVMAGPVHGALEQKFLDAAKERLESRLELLGPVYGEDKRRFYRTTDLFWFPTQYKAEAQPIVLVEALQHGIPCASMDRGCISWLLEPCGMVASDVTEFKRDAVRQAVLFSEDRGRDRESSQRRFRQLRTMEGSAIAQAVKFLNQETEIPVDPLHGT
ncbi:MAG: glycosyltransferase [Planctomycetota bacterium]